MLLTDTAIRNAKQREKQYKLSDEKGLYLLVKPAGKYFRLDYRFGGKRKTLALGVYPTVRLQEAREKRDDARKLIANGVDPAQHLKETKAMRVEQAANSFEAVAREWFAKFSHSWAQSHAKKIIRRFELYVFPWLGSRPIAEITAPELLAELRRIESRGILETTHRRKQNCGQVFRYAIATGRAERDPSADLKGALAPVKHGRMATITEPKSWEGIEEPEHTEQDFLGKETDMKLNDLTKQHFQDLMTMTASQPCTLCGGKADNVGCFNPVDSQEFGAPAGKARFMFYPICLKCAAEKDAIEKVEAMPKLDFKPDVSIQ